VARKNVPLYVFWLTMHAALQRNSSSRQRLWQCMPTSTVRRLGGVTVRTFGLQSRLKRSWFQLPIGSLSSGYYVHRWLSADR